MQALLDEIARVKNLIHVCANVRSNSAYKEKAIMEAIVGRAEKAIQDDNEIQMIELHEQLKEFK